MSEFLIYFYMNEGWIRERLKFIGATQGDLATAIGRDRAVVSRILGGRQSLSLEWVGAFARVLHLTPAELLQKLGLDMQLPRERRRMIIGMSGATGMVYGVRLLEILRQMGIETHLVISRAGVIALGQETSYSLREVAAKAAVHYRIADIAAPVASGSYRTMGMIIAPCSVRSMAEIATGATSNLLTRAADVVLKERRKLVLMVRETPLHTGHLRAMTQLSEMGAIIAPPVPAFYARPASLEDMVDHTLGRILDLFDLEMTGVKRWGDDVGARGGT